MKKKLLTVIVPMVLILVIAGVAVGMWFQEKYSYSKETVDRQEYFQVSGEECAIILQDEMIEEKAVAKDGVCYMSLAAVHKYLNDTFYVDKGEGLLLYTDAQGTALVNVGEKSFTDREGDETLPYIICYLEDETYYLAMDYVKRFTNFSYEYFGDHLQLYTQWGEAQTAQINKDTQVRLKGGIKSPVLRQLTKGETVEILERMETWSKIKTSDSLIGYVENKRMDGESIVKETPVTDYTEPEYQSLLMDKKVCLGWHSIGGIVGNGTLDSMVANAKGMNVIAPTWFSLNDDQGGFRNFGENSYVERAHALGLQVWGVWDNFNFENETGTPVDDYAVLSSTTNRRRLVQGIVDTAQSLGLDGVNLDFERLSADCGEHFTQFVRELSVECHGRQLVFSIDNYMPNEGNKYYRLDVQGKAADYVVLMGYDEHWHGCGEPGSVASINFVSQGIAKTLEKVPKEKVVNALPFYTIVWAVDGTDVTDEYLTMSNTADFLANRSEAPVWDETTCQNYLEWVSGSKTYSVWLEDAESIRVKLNVMSTNDIAGVAVWRLGFGTPAAWELIQAYVNL
ncbi:MAG: glycosyl hydrolase family 18 protein [Roseburia sp.]|nr:glycosyl hydrolase family 18 protein [Roseburia sp.]